MGVAGNVSYVGLLHSCPRGGKRLVVGFFYLFFSFWFFTLWLFIFYLDTKYPLIHSHTNDDEYHMFCSLDIRLLTV